MQNQENQENKTHSQDKRVSLETTTDHPDVVISKQGISSMCYSYRQLNKRKCAYSEISGKRNLSKEKWKKKEILVLKNTISKFFFTSLDEKS